MCLGGGGDGDGGGGGGVGDEPDGVVAGELLMSLPGELDGEVGALGADEAADDGEEVPLGLGLGAEDGDAPPPDELQELQPAPLDDADVQRAQELGLQAAVVVTPLDSEEL